MYGAHQRVVVSGERGGAVSAAWLDSSASVVRFVRSFVVADVVVVVASISMTIKVTRVS